jgi:hypothetical protein
LQVRLVTATTLAGEKLAQLPNDANPVLTEADLAQGGVVQRRIIGGRVMDVEVPASEYNGNNAISQLLSVRVNHPANGTKLATLKGVVQLPLNSTQSIVVKDPLKAEKREYKEGSLAFRLLDVKSIPGGVEVAMEASSENPFGGRLVGGGIVMQNVQIQVNGQVIIQGGNTSKSGQIKIEDAQGRSFIQTGNNVTTQVNNNQAKTIWRLTFHAPDGKAAPHRLIYSDLRPTTIEAPFDFKDILLTSK